MYIYKKKLRWAGLGPSTHFIRDGSKRDMLCSVVMSAVVVVICLGNLQPCVSTCSHLIPHGCWPRVAELLLLSSLMTRCAYVSPCRPHPFGLVDRRRSHQSSRAVLHISPRVLCYVTCSPARSPLMTGCGVHRSSSKKGK